MNDANVLVGRVRWKDLPDETTRRPRRRWCNSARRPSDRVWRLPPFLDRMRRAGVKAILATTSHGRLLRVVNRDDGERFVRYRAARSRSAEPVA